MVAPILCDVALLFNAASNYSSLHSRDQMEPRELLRALMKRDGDNPNSLSTKLKGRVSQPQIYKFVTGVAAEPRRATLAPLAKHYDLPLDVFYDAELAEAAFKRLGLTPELSGENVLLRAPAAAGGGTAGIGSASEEDVEIRQYRTGGAMGSGLVLRDQPGVIREWKVSREWVEKNVPYYTSLENLSIVTGFGDSMMGLFNPGDPLLVDRGITKADVDGVYFFRVGDEGFIKRLQRIPGEGIVVISENKNYRDWTIKPDMDFQVMAKVLRAWNGHSL